MHNLSLSRPSEVTNLHCLMKWPRWFKLLQYDGAMCRPQTALEDLTLSRWEWAYPLLLLQQPLSKWQNPSFCIDQLFFCLLADTFRHFRPLSVHMLSHPLNLASRSLLIPNCDWLSCNLRWTVTDECKLFFLLPLSFSPLGGVMKSYHRWQSQTGRHSSGALAWVM